MSERLVEAEVLPPQEDGKELQKTGSGPKPRSQRRAAHNLTPEQLKKIPYGDRPRFRKTEASEGRKKDPKALANRPPQYNGVAHEIPVRSGAKNQFGLTPKQEKFAQGMARGLYLSDAYREAYDTSRMLQKTVWQAASVLAAKARVRERVEMIVRESKESALHDGVKIREFVLRGLHKEATSAETGSARIRALELLGKLDVTGMFTDKKEVTHIDRTPQEIEQDLEAALARLQVTIRED